MLQKPLFQRGKWIIQFYLCHIITVCPRSQSPESPWAGKTAQQAKVLRRHAESQMPELSFLNPCENARMWQHTCGILALLQWGGRQRQETHLETWVPANLKYTAQLPKRGRLPEQGGWWAREMTGMSMFWLWSWWYFRIPWLYNSDARDAA